MIRRLLIDLVVALALATIFIGCWIYHATSTVGRVVHSWAQPKEMDYKSYGPYTLHVREKMPDWRLLGGRTPRHEIFIGRDDSYGHWFDCTFHAGSLDEDEIDAYIRRSTVEWTDEGVSVKQESGHVIFFPKKTFIGGR
jgi:hypothetical protein